MSFFKIEYLISWSLEPADGWQLLFMQYIRTLKSCLACYYPNNMLCKCDYMQLPPIFTRQLETLMLPSSNSCTCSCPLPSNYTFCREKIYRKCVLSCKSMAGCFTRPSHLAFIGMADTWENMPYRSNTFCHSIIYNLLVLPTLTKQNHSRDKQSGQAELCD